MHDRVVFYPSDLAPTLTSQGAVDEPFLLHFDLTHLFVSGVATLSRLCGSRKKHTIAA